MTCSRLGTTLYLEIQNNNEVTKASDFQQDIVGEVSCMKRIMKYNKGCGQLSSNGTFFAYSCFNGMKIAEEANA